MTLTVTEKEKFIRSLCDQTRDAVIARIKHMPEEWDGLELREYLARQFEGECYLSRKPSDTSKRRRLRDFRNTVVTTFGL
jgi:hypothetical protein